MLEILSEEKYLYNEESKVHNVIVDNPIDNGLWDIYARFLNLLQSEIQILQ